MYPRLQYVRGYALGVARSELSIKQRILSILVIGRYFFQVTKWSRVIRARLFGADFGAGNADILRRNVVGVEARNCHNDKGDIRA
jgi:hypothetical protein